MNGKRMKIRGVRGESVAEVHPMITRDDEVCSGSVQDMFRECSGPFSTAQALFRYLCRVCSETCAGAQVPAQVENRPERANLSGYLNVAFRADFFPGDPWRP